MSGNQQLVVSRAALAYIARPQSEWLQRFERTREVPHATPNTRTIRFFGTYVE